MSLEEFDGILEEMITDLSVIMDEKQMVINAYCFEDGADESIAGEAIEIMTVTNELIERFKKLKQGGINFGSFKTFLKNLASNIDIKIQESGSKKKESRSNNNQRGLETI